MESDLQAQTYDAAWGKAPLACYFQLAFEPRAGHSLCCPAGPRFPFGNRGGGMAVWKIVVCVGFFISGVLQMARPAAVLFGANIGMSTFDIGVLVATYSLVPALIAIHAGLALDKIGERTPIIIGSLVVALGQLLPVLFPSQWALYMAQVLLGLGELAVIMSLQKLMGVSSTPATRDRNFAWFSTAVSLGALLGPFGGGFIADRLSYVTVFGTGAVIAVIAAVIGFLLPREASLRPSQASSLSASLQLLRQRPVQRAMLSGTLAQYSRDIFVSYFPLYGLSQGLSPSEIGLVLSVQGISLIGARVALPLMLRVGTRDHVLFLSVVLSGLAFMVIPLGHAMAVTYLATIAIGFGLGNGQPISMSQAFEASPPGRNGEVLGLRLTALRVAQFVAPLFFGVVGSRLGILGVFVVNGAFLLGGGFTLRAWSMPER